MKSLIVSAVDGVGGFSSAVIPFPFSLVNSSHSLVSLLSSLLA